MTDKPLKFPSDFDDHWGNLKVSMSKVQSAKRLLKQNQQKLLTDILTEFCQYVPKSKRQGVSTKLSNWVYRCWTEIDACFQIPDGDEKE